MSRSISRLRHDFKCINGDDKGKCIAKEESPFDSFLCDNGEQFELYEE